MTGLKEVDKLNDEFWNLVNNVVTSKKNHRDAIAALNKYEKENTKIFRGLKTNPYVGYHTLLDILVHNQKVERHEEKLEGLNNAVDVLYQATIDAVGTLEYFIHDLYPYYTGTLRTWDNETPQGERAYMVSVVDGDIVSVNEVTE